MSVQELQSTSGDKKIDVLLVDDDPEILQAFGMLLERRGYAVTPAATAGQALQLATGTDFSVALVDYCLPGSEIDGIELIAHLRKTRPLTVSLLVTVYNHNQIGFRASQAGAFDCLNKPLPRDTLLPVVRAALNERARREQRRALLVVGDIEIDRIARTVTVAGEPVSFSSQELALLLYLAERYNCVVSYDELWKNVWGYTGPADRHLIRKAINRLRNKIGRQRIISVRTKGYRLVETAHESARWLWKKRKGKQS